MKRTLRVILLFSFCILFTTEINSQIGGAAFGIALDRLTDRVSDLIRQAENSGNIVVVQAGGQVALAIQNAKTAYRSELDLTVDRLNSAQKSLLDDLASKITAIEQQIVSDMQDIINRGQTAFNIIPLSNKLPQVSGYTPIYCALNPFDLNLRVDIAGNFYDLSREDYDANLLFNGHVYKSRIKTTARLMFEIPLSEIQNTATSLTANYITVEIPYKEGWWIFGSKEKSTFKLMITTLPETAGKVNYTTIRNVPDVERQSNRSTNMTQESDRDDIRDRQHCWQASSGWRIIPSSVWRVVTWEQGDEGNDRDWWWNNNTSTLQNACWTLTTIKRRFGTSGKVHFYLTFDEERDIMREEKTETEIPLTWGTIKVENFPVGGAWKAVYTQFNGKQIDISIPFNNPFLKVSTSGNQVSFTTVSQ